MPTFYKYADSPTVYQDSDSNAFSDAKSAFAAGVKSDWSNVETRQKQAVAAPQTFSFMDNSTYDINKNPVQVSNSSTPVDNAVTNLGNKINTTQQDTTLQSLLDLYKQSSESNQKNSEASLKLLQDQQAKYDKQREDELARINAEYDTAKATKEDEYQKKIAPDKRRLELLQGTPYGPNATLEEELTLKLQGLETTHKNEMNTLFNARQSFIANAQNAYMEKDFALAERQLKLAADTEANMYKQQQDFLQLNLQFQQEQRAQQTLEYNMAAEKRKQTEDIRKFALDNGLSPTAPFFAVGGQIFATATWQAFDTKEQAIAAGVKPDLSNVQMISEQGSGIVAEYNKFLQDVAAGREKYMTFNQFQNMDANRKAKIAAAGVVSPADTREYDLLVKQAPASVSALKDKGYSWQAIAELFQKQGVDPGMPEIDDALHRAFQSQTDYEKWKQAQAKAKRGVTVVSTTKNKQGQTVVTYSDGSTDIVN